MKTGLSGTAQPMPATTKNNKLAHFGAVARLDPIVAAPQIQNTRNAMTMMLATSLRFDLDMDGLFLAPATLWPLAVRSQSFK